MAFTDPPYGVAYTGGLQFKDGEVIKNNQKMIMNDDKDIYADVFPILAKYVDGACYIWFAGTKASSLYQAAESLGDIHALIIWVKNGGYGALNANYKQKHEPCLYWKPKNTSLKFVGETTETTIWEIDKDGRNKLHPTQKPVELATKAIKNHSAKTVLDLFGGSGSTLIAAQETNRTAYLMELDPHYVDVICARFQKLTGVLPVLESSGKVHDFLNA
jgi:DNA modification methylase